VRNIASNTQLEFYLPSLVEMMSDLVDAERCAVYLYDRAQEELYCKVITGRIKKQIAFRRVQSGDVNENILCRAFNSGKPQHVKNAYEARELIGDYLQID
jgi:hypothetical protein